MKAIFCMPAHPSYFDPAENYTQEEIEAALRRLDAMMGGRLFKGMTDLKVPQEFRFLRVPGQPIQVIFDSAGYGDGKPYDQASKDRGVEQYRGTSHDDLQTHIGNLKECLKMVRQGYPEWPSLPPPAGGEGGPPRW
jgi:hypothetical protein